MTEVKHRKLFETLKANILANAYGAGHAFPSEAQLFRTYGVSRTTIRKALDDLRHEGLIRSQRGRGTFVTRKGASRKIGLIVPSIRGSEFYPELVSALSKVIRESGYTLLFADFSAGDPAKLAGEVKAFAEKLVEENVAGVIYQPLEFLTDAPEWSRKVLGVFDAAAVPVVLMVSDIDFSPSRSAYDVVAVNNVAAGRRLADHLVAAGARKVDFVIRPHYGPCYADRLEGVLNASRQAKGRAAFKVRVFLAEPDDLAALRRHLKRGRPDAFVCGCDALAGRFRRTLEKAGLSVPGDVMLAGFNDLHIARFMSPPLTTIHQPCALLAQTAFDTLLARIADPRRPTAEHFLDAPLVIRESTARRSTKKEQKK